LKEAPMKLISRFAAVASLGLALAGTAHAATVMTTALPSGTNLANQTMYCDVVNRRGAPVTLTIETRKDFGIVVDPAVPVTLAADQVHSISGSPSARYCVFNVQGSTKYIEGMAVFLDNITLHYTAAVPAR